MNHIEEKLWNYIDGSCTTAEAQHIAGLIEQDEVYRLKYHELLKLNDEFSTMELDEPPMAFTYHVMEGIRAEHAKQPLKAVINKRIIWSIAAFFIVTILALLVVAFSSLNWTTTASTGVKLPQQLNAAHINNIFSGALMKGFLFFGSVMGLFLGDSLLRKKSGLKQV
ncbi:hypothetical protein DYU05_19355 [Mucilaginibacter terrenus]|uniref:Zf-HC2 domain-containing protein n=1 Tax=Mucilaginibacter terrenus TaxID=2482727 RepID=A0A3E2NKL1_9SPHI|nr:hypothetical protein [Mucilaginibacter terrenus]RFZ81440.1 hypothetical protein DYU05_19355 [Mucilaginibacter terrenus]